MKDKKKKNRLWSGEFKLKVVLDIIENELSYSQAARKYDMYLSSGSLNDTLPARWVYQYRLYGKERFFQTPKDYRKNPVRKFHKPSKEVEQDLELKVKHLEMELEYTKKLIALVQKQEQTKIPSSQGTKAKICIKRSTSNIRTSKIYLLLL